MSNDVESRFDKLLEKVEKRSRAARIISILLTVLTVIPIVIGLAILYTTIKEVEKAKNELTQIRQDSAVSTAKSSEEIKEKVEQIEKYGELVREINKDLPATDVDKRILNPNSTTARLPPRIYVQIRDGERGKAKEIAKKLEERGFLVPGIEVVAQGAGNTEVRFFKQDERVEAEKITKILKGLGVNDATSKYIEGHENSAAIRPRHYEIWLDSGSLQNTAQHTAQLNIRERQTGDVTILDLSGRITTGEDSARMSETVSRLLGEGRNKILINLEYVSFVDNSGVGALASSYTATNRNRGQLKLLNLTSIQDLLIITKLATVFEIYNNEQEAVASFK